MRIEEMSRNIEEWRHLLRGPWPRRGCRTINGWIYLRSRFLTLIYITVNVRE
jgi:hypothetical protein